MGGIGKLAIFVALTASGIVPAYAADACSNKIADLLEDFDDVFKGIKKHNRIHNDFIERNRDYPLEKRAEMAANRAAQQSGRTEGEWNILFEATAKKIKRELRSEPSCLPPEFAKMAGKLAPTASEDGLFAEGYLRHTWYQR